MTNTTTPFVGVIRSRRSARKFLPTPVPASDIRAVLEDAQTAPSNSNTQPWGVDVVSGALRDAISEGLLRAYEDGRESADFTFDYGDGTYLERSHAHGATLYQAWGIGRSDVEGRREVVAAPQSMDVPARIRVLTDLER